MKTERPKKLLKKYMKNIAIIGSGSWGTALAVYLANKGHNVKIWSYAKEEQELINNERKCKFLPEAEIPENVNCYLDYEEVIKGTFDKNHNQQFYFVASATPRK